MAEGDCGYIELSHATSALYLPGIFPPGLEVSVATCARRRLDPQHWWESVNQSKSNTGGRRDAGDPVEMSGKSETGKATQSVVGIESN